MLLQHLGHVDARAIQDKNGLPPGPIWAALKLLYCRALTRFILVQVSVPSQV